MVLVALCECPGAVAGAGEPEIDQAAEVEGGGQLWESGVVLGDAPVGDAAVAAGSRPAPGRRLAGPAVVAVDLVRAVIDHIAADVHQLARARRVQDLNTAAMLPGPRAERRRRLAEC